MPHPSNPSDVVIIKADYELRNRIGVALKHIFTPERIASAQRVLDQGSNALKEDCLAQVQSMRRICHENIDNNLEIPIDTLSYHALNIKSAAGMAGYPIATDMADMLAAFCRSLKKVDEEALDIIIKLADTINAMFREDRKGEQDALSLAIMRELRANIESYWNNHL